MTRKLEAWLDLIVKRGEAAITSPIPTSLDLQG